LAAIRRTGFLVRSSRIRGQRQPGVDPRHTEAIAYGRRLHSWTNALKLSVAGSSSIDTICDRVSMQRAVDYLQEIGDAEAAFRDADTTKALQAAAELLRPGVEGTPRIPAPRAGEALI